MTDVEKLTDLDWFSWWDSLVKPELLKTLDGSSRLTKFKVNSEWWDITNINWIDIKVDDKNNPTIFEFVEWEYKWEQLFTYSAIEWLEKSWLLKLPTFKQLTEWIKLWKESYWDFEKFVKTEKIKFCWNNSFSVQGSFVSIWSWDFDEDMWGSVYMCLGNDWTYDSNFADWLDALSVYVVV